MKWGILILAILAVLVAPANLFGTEEWEKELMDEGWVKLNFKNFPERDRVNTTWFGHGRSKSGNTNYEDRVFYISSDGRKIFLDYKDLNFSDRGTRVVTKDKVCYRWETQQGGKKKCSPKDWTLWKKGNITLVVSSSFGTEMGRYIIEKGNPKDFSVLVGPPILFAPKEWEQKWMDEGWVRVKYDNNNLMKFANTTWYGQVGENQSYENRIFYIDPSGRKTFSKRREFSSVHLGTWEIGKNGRICQKKGHKKRCDRTLWEKNGKYMLVSDIVFEVSVWKIKMGNLENFK